ncbi:MAG: DUF5706 domain-containing protein [Roseburia sp.]|nr:DUF5706 domain-containing protein [Roseburia sp.]
MQEQRDFLNKSLDSMNYWLQFAETKNAAMIAFVVAMLAVIYGGEVINHLVLKIVITIIYVISLLLSVISFYPKYKKDVWACDGTYEVNDNLLFWKDISKYSVNDYLKAVSGKLFQDENERFDLFQRMYAEEMITNARIAKAKYLLFEAATKFVALATVLLPVFIVIAEYV